MQYGYFSDENREYRITSPFTPIKWCNYVGTLGFGGIVDQTGGALLCKGDPALNRFTILNPDGKMKGISSLLIDGRKVQGNKIPVLPAGHYQVQAYLGR